MRKMIEVLLPWPPSINHYKRVGRTVMTKSGAMYQTRVNTNETKQFNYEVWMKVRGISAAQGVKFEDTDTLMLEVDAYPPDHRKRDISNIIKVLEDSLQNAGLFKDDFMIARLIVQRMTTIPNGQVFVRISVIDGASDERKSG